MQYKPKGKIWIELNDKAFLGEGRVRLLKAISETGSLSKAAKHIGMSYKKAWGLLNAMSELAPKKIVETHIGGTNGGGTQLTPYGERLIQLFEKAKHENEMFLNNLIEEKI